MARSLGSAVTLSAAPARRWRTALLAYATYVVGVVVATWPLVLAPASSWPDHHDPALFTWVMTSTARRLLHTPGTLFHGNAFYPHGLSLAFSEILLVPTLLGLPGFVAGNPVLTYNLLVLLLWPVNGVAMAWAAHEVTGSRSAAWLAGAVFSLSPYFTEYHLEFNMLPAASVPVAIVAWVRWLERQQIRWLMGALVAVVVQGYTSWYYTIILGLGLLTLTLGFCALRWRDWQVRRDLTALLVGGAVTAAILAPLVWPYWVVHSEFGYERGLTETGLHYADLLSFVEPGARSRFFPMDWTGHVPETSPFVGYSALGLVILSLWWTRREATTAGGPRWLGRCGVTLFALAIAAMGVVGFLRHHTYRVGFATLRLQPEGALDLALGAGLGLLAARGWAHWRQRAPRDLSPGDWARLLAFLVGVSVVLALGPTVHVARRTVGAGPYAALYQVLLPLHAIRITVRFGVLTVSALALLAALGWTLVAGRLGARPAVRRGLAVVAVSALLVEYAVWPADLVPVIPRPVDAVLGADPEDVAVLEWPCDAARTDTEAMFRSLYHGKRVVNGHSGFVPPSLRDLCLLLREPGPPFPIVAARDAFRRVHALRYVVARLGSSEFQDEWRAPWLQLRREAPPWLRFRGTYGSDDLYEVVSLPEHRRHVKRLVSRDMLVQHPWLKLGVAPLGSWGLTEQAVDVRLNGRLLRRLPLTGPVTAEVLVGFPGPQAAPSVITADYVYVPPPGWLRDDLYRIGRTGVKAPGDLYVSSAGRPYGDGRSTIQLNGRDLASASRGYNLVALAPDGGARGAGVFDTCGDADAAARLAAWVSALPGGTIVLGAVSDEGSTQLGADAVAALSTLGVETDMRGRFRESHAFVGVKGAAHGAALEGAGPRVVELRVGSPEFPPGFALTEFTLIDAPAR